MLYFQLDSQLHKGPTKLALLKWTLFLKVLCLKLLYVSYYRRESKEKNIFLEIPYSVHLAQGFFILIQFYAIMILFLHSKFCV